MELFVAKIILSFVFALALIWIAESWSPRVSGIISSLPNISLVIMIFVGLEQGVNFSKNASVYSIYGVLANLVLVTSIIHFSKKTNVVLNAIVSICLYDACLYTAVNHLPANEEIAFLITFCVWIISLITLRNIPLMKIKNKKSSRSSEVFLKFIAISIVLVTTTSLASFIGEKWTGVITTFPGVTLPVALFIGLKYDGEVFRSFLKGAIFAWPPTAFYFLVTSKVYSQWGIISGSLFALLMCLVFMGLMELFWSKIKTIQRSFIPQLKKDIKI